MEPSSRVLTMTATICSAALICILVFFTHKTSYGQNTFSSVRKLQTTSVPQEAPKLPPKAPEATATTSGVPQTAPTGGLVTAMVTNKFAAGTLEGAEASRGYKEIKGTHFQSLISAALGHKRGRKMNDLTKDPPTNSLQTLLNTWTDGSYSPVHKVHFSPINLCM